MPTSILVTGASGAIGSNIIKHILAGDADASVVACYYRNSSLIDFSGDKNSNRRVSLIPYRDALTSNSSYDQIWHLATYGQPARFIDDWQPIVKLNTQDIVQLATKLKPGGLFLYASTSEVYGNTTHCTELTVPSTYTCTPRAVYTDSKRLGESILASILPKEQYRIFRICLAYSESFRPGDRRVMYELVSKGVVDGSVSLLDDGSAQRQYIHIDDACSMMLTLANQGYPSLKLEGNVPIFNICNPDPITILGLAQLIGKCLQVPVYKGPSKANPTSALSVVSILPSRYLSLYPNTNFIKLQTGITNLCKYSKEFMYSSGLDVQTK